MKILLVDDERLLVKGLMKSLVREGYQVETAFDGEEAMALVEQGEYNLIILDLMLPKIDGLTICQKVRSKGDTPIIMLTAKGEDVDKIIGLEMGADDYLSKPFNTRELLARIKAVLRRYQRKTKDHDQELQKGELRISFRDHRIYVADKEIDLTAKEFDLLILLAQNPGRIFTREKLLEQVWGYDYIGEDRTVDVHVRRLREKIEANPGQPKFVLTKWGVGYFFNEGE